MKVEGIPASRDETSGAIIYDQSDNQVQIARARNRKAQEQNNQDKYIKNLEKRLSRLEAKVKILMKE